MDRQATIGRHRRGKSLAGRRCGGDWRLSRYRCSRGNWNTLQAKLFSNRNSFIREKRVSEWERGREREFRKATKRIDNWLEEPREIAQLDEANEIGREEITIFTYGVAGALSIFSQLLSINRKMASIPSEEEPVSTFLSTRNFLFRKIQLQIEPTFYLF